MKKINKILTFALIVVFMFTLIPTYSFAEETSGAIFADVNSNTMYKTAIEELYTKKIVDGYLDENGNRTFKPDATITRGEFSKLLAVALPNKIVLNMNETSSGFSDVDTDPSVAWTIPYVKAAANANIVNGYEDSTFRANNPVSYAEATKMIVCAMGYSSVIPVTDPWYDGYILVADQLKIRIGAEGSGDHNAAAPRGLVAQLICNMANSDKIEQNEYVPGLEIEGGEKDELPTASGMVTAVFDKGLSNTATNLSKTEMVIDGITYDFRDFKTYEQMMSYLGYRVEVSYESRSNRKSIKSIEKYDAYNYKVNSSQLGNVNSGVLEYYEDNTEKKAKYNTSTYIFYNGTPTGPLSLAQMTTLLTITNGYIEFVDNDTNGVADVAYIYNYNTYVVGTFDNTSNTITDKYDGTPVTLGYAGQEEGDEKTIFKVLNSSGNMVDGFFSNISKDTVISVASPYNGDPNGMTEVIICKNTVNGEVTAIGTDYIKVGTKKYNKSSYYDAIVTLNAANAVQKGNATLYLDFNGDVVAAKSQVNKLYGYIVDVVNADGGSADAKIRMLTTNSGIKEFSLRDNVDINKVTVSKRQVVNLLKISADVINAGATGKTAAGLADNAMYSQPVIYETNSAGLISSLTTVANGGESPSDALEYSLGKTTGTEKLTYKVSGRTFNRSSSKVFSVTYDSASDYKANIFVVPVDRADEEDYAVYTSNNSFFENSKQYHVEAFNVDSIKLYGNIVVVYGMPDPEITGENKACIITSTTDSEEYGQYDATVLRYKELGVANPAEKYVYIVDDTLLAGLNNGDIIKFATKRNDDKIASKIEKVVVGGQLYEALNGGSSQSVSVDFTFTEAHEGNSTYFKAYMGRILSAGSDGIQLISRIADMPAEDDPSYNTILNSTKDYNVSGTATHVIVVDQSKVATKPLEAIKYGAYNTITLKSIEENGVGNEDLVYIHFKNSSTVSAIVIYR